jgi:hypothetical protein
MLRCPAGIWDSAPSTANVERNFNTGQVEWQNANPQFSAGFLTDSKFHLYQVLFYINGSSNRQVDVYREMMRAMEGTRERVEAGGNPDRGQGQSKFHFCSELDLERGATPAAPTAYVF